MATIPRDQLDAAAALLLAQGTVQDVPVHRLVAMCRRAGLAPADTAQLVQALVAESRRYSPMMEREIEALASQDVPAQGDTLRDLVAGTGWHHRDTWLQLAGLLSLPRCVCGRPREAIGFLRCGTCRRNTRGRVKKHRQRKRRDLRLSQRTGVAAPAVPPARLPADQQRRRRWHRRIVEKRMPLLSDEERRALRNEAFRVYGATCRDCDEADRRVLHLHHPSGRGEYWRRVATLWDPRTPGAVGSHDRELLQLQMDEWPVGWFVTLCFACHAIEHGMSSAVVARERERMESIKDGEGGAEVATVTRAAGTAWEAVSA